MIATALIVALAGVFPSIATLGERRDFFFFDVDLHASTAGQTTLYWGDGHTVDPRLASGQPVRPLDRAVRYRYMLSLGTLQVLKLVPLDREGRVVLQDPRIVDHRGQKVMDIPAAMLTAPPSRVLLLPSGEVEINNAAGAAPAELTFHLPVPLELELSFRTASERVAPRFLFLFAAALFIAWSWLWTRPWREASFRHLESISARRPKRTVFFVSLSAVLIQSHPVVFQGRSFVSPNNGGLMLYGQLPTLPGYTDTAYADTMGSDIGAMLFQHLYIPMVQREALFSHGEWPLWNRYNNAGVPLLGQGQSMFGDPLNFITIFANGSAWSWDLRFLLARILFAFGLGMCVFQLTRRLRGALLTAFVAPFIGYFVYRLNHPALFSVGYSPWILSAWIGLIQTRDRRDLISRGAALGLANAWVLCSGTVKEAGALLLCLNGAGLCLAAVINPRTLGRCALTFGAGTAVTALITAPAWSTFLHTLGQAKTLSENVGQQPLPAVHLIGLFEEMFFRQGGTGEWVGGPSLNLIFLVGTGLAVAFLGNPAYHRRVAGLLLASLPPALIAFGAIPSDWISRMPFIGSIGHIGNTFSCPLLVTFGILGGVGFTAWGDSGVSPHEKRRAAAVAASLIAAIACIYLISTDRPAEHAFFRGYAVSCALILAAGLWFLRQSIPYAGSRDSSSAAQATVAALVVVTTFGAPILLWKHMQWRSSPFAHYAFTPGPRVEFDASGSAAVAAVANASSTPGRILGLQYNLFPAFHSALQWESLYGVDALQSRYFAELVRAFGFVRAWNWEAPHAPEDLGAQKAFLDLFNVEHLLADRGTKIEDAGFERVAELDLMLFRNRTAWPRAFFTSRLGNYDELSELSRKVKAAAGPSAFVHRTQPEHTLLASSDEKPKVVAARNYLLTANKTRFTVEVPSAGVAVLTETFFPESFQARVNGTPAQVFRVNHAFKGVFLSQAGTYTVEFDYWPKYFTASLWASGAGFVIAALLGLRSFFRDRNPLPTARN